MTDSEQERAIYLAYPRHVAPRAAQAKTWSVPSAWRSPFMKAATHERGPSFPHRFCRHAGAPILAGSLPAWMPPG